MPTEHDDELAARISAILASYRLHQGLALLEGRCLPSRETVWAVVEDLLRILFPGFLEVAVSAEDFADRTEARVRSIAQRLRVEIECGLRFESADCSADASARAEQATLTLLDRIPAVRDLLADDVAAAYDGDPAARSVEEIVLAYPGLQAIAVYRLANVLHTSDVPIVPRVMTEYAHSRTGIDIHPGATIGRRFFIDHGTGVVIGETCVIGNGVKIYQGVTLGAQSFPRDERGRVIKGTKRHPDIEDDATIYSGATILGPVRIGRGAIIGGNVWVTADVPPGTRIVIRPGQQMQSDRPVRDYQI
jgi:serine O-acetyltransferase